MAELPNPPCVPKLHSGGTEPFARSGRPSADRAARSFKPRGRMSPTLRRAMQTVAPALLIPPAVGLLDVSVAFGRDAPLIVDLGFGMGDTTVALAHQHPASAVLGIDVHLPGVARVADRAAAAGLTNIRLISADGIDVLRHMLAEGSISLIQIAFPDPWPKPSQRHRRLVDARFVALVASRLAPGGVLRLATDVDDYAVQMLSALRSEPLLTNVHDAFAPRDASRPATKFERRALAAGRTVHDLAFQRVDADQRSESNTAGST